MACRGVDITLLLDVFCSIESFQLITLYGGILRYNVEIIKVSHILLLRRDSGPLSRHTTAVHE